jgi:methionyl-tRNA formyltransferase
MNAALMGSVSSSYCALEALARAGVEITGVLGLDESRAGTVSDYRSLRPLAARIGADFLSFVKVSEPGVETFLSAHQPDLLWVIGLSQLVPERLVRIARHGGIGFHPTMLPQGRGRAPVAWTILLNDRAAVSLFFLTNEPDAGDLIVQRPVPVLPGDYSEDLIARTNEVLSDVIAELAPAIGAGTLPRTPQDHTRATYYPQRTPADGLINWTLSTDAVYRLVRAAGRPYPGAFTYAAGRKLTVWRARPARDEELNRDATSAALGTVVRVDETQGALVRTGDGALWLTETVWDRAGTGTEAWAPQVGMALTGPP